MIVYDSDPFVAQEEEDKRMKQIVVIGWTPTREERRTNEGILEILFFGRGLKGK